MKTNVVATPGELRVVPGPQPVGPPIPSTVKKRRRRPVWWVAAGMALAVAVIGLEAWRATHATPPVRYVTAAVTRGDVIRAVSATGTVNPVTTIQVGTYVSGAIQNLYCDYNTKVRKGQICAKIDPRPYQTIVDQDRASLGTAKAQLAKDQTSLDYAKLSFDRTTTLRAKGIISQDTLDAAENAYNQAVAQVDLDRSTVAQHAAALEASEVNLAYTDIVSPVNGTVVSRNVNVGQTVAASFQTPTLFLIADDLTRMQVDANVSESDIGGVAEGSEATFSVEAFPNRTFEGIVTQLRQAPQTVQNVVTYDVVISVVNKDLVLLPGMTATVRVLLATRKNVLRVPDQALRYHPGGLSSGGSGPSVAGSRAEVWVIRNGVATPITVQTGIDDDSYTEVVQGELREGDRVVTAEQAPTGTAPAPMFRL